MNQISATNARSNLYELFKKTVSGHLLTRISSKEGNVILLSEEDYESLVETAELLSVKGLKKSIEKADKEIKERDLFTLEDIFGE